MVLHGFPLSCWEQDNWDHDGGFDAIVVEQSRDASRERALLRRLRKSFPRVPLIAFVARSKETPSSMDNNRTGFSLHLSGVPSVEGLRSHLRAAERHAELSKKSSTLARRFRETSLRLQVLSDIVSTANSILEPERVLGVIMSQIQKLIPSEAWSILLVDEQRKELTFEMALGEKGEEFSDIRLKIGEGIAGWVARTGKPVIVNDVSRDPRFQGRFDEQTQFRTRAVLCAPLVSRGRTIGVVEILNRASGRRFTKRDL
ncbi:MAG: GAF domain-containing protein, partial [Acidobacteriota bacterium]